MCYTGGPRCASDAKKAYINAKKKHKEHPTPENKRALDKSIMDYACTPEQIKKISRKDPEKGAALQKRYDHLINGYREYEIVRKENKAALGDIREAMAKERGVYRTFRAIAAEAANEHQVLQWHEQAQGGDEQSDIDSAHALQKLKEYESRADEAKRKYLTLKGQEATLVETNTRNRKLREQGRPIEYSHYMPEAFAGYFASTEKKHFDPKSSGSTFTECRSLNEVMSLAHKQRGTLSGDDREQLIARGADPNSFAHDKRYLMVETKGNLGVVSSADFKKASDQNIMLTVTQKAEGVKPVCSMESSSQPTTKVATIVLVDNPTNPGTEKSPTLLITAFPGTSGQSGSNDDLLPYVGKQITLGEARKIYGREFSINTIMKQST